MFFIQKKIPLLRPPHNSVFSVPLMIYIGKENWLYDLQLLQQAHQIGQGHQVPEAAHRIQKKRHKRSRHINMGTQVPRLALDEYRSNSHTCYMS